MYSIHSGNFCSFGRRSKKLTAATYFFAKVDHGKDPAYKQFDGVCSRCQKGVTFDKGARLKGATGKKGTVAFSFGELYALYEKFERQRIEKAKQFIKREVKPDPFIKFVVERTDICPHQFVEEDSVYWLETISLLDGEMGLTLPCDIRNVPAVFFDALTIVRSARSQARKEEVKDGK